MKYHRIYIEQGRASPPGKKPLKKTPYRVHYNADVLLERTFDPEFDACRALISRGLSGSLETSTFGGNSTVRLKVGLEWGPKRRTAETAAQSPRRRQWQPWRLRPLLGVDR